MTIPKVAESYYNLFELIECVENRNLRDQFHNELGRLRDTLEEVHGIEFILDDD